jgi:hypothetical protein
MPSILIRHVHEALEDQPHDAGGVVCRKTARINARKFRLLPAEFSSKLVRVRWQSRGAFQPSDLLDTNSAVDSLPGQCAGFCQGRILIVISLLSSASEEISPGRLAVCRSALSKLAPGLLLGFLRRLLFLCRHGRFLLGFFIAFLFFTHGFHS